MLITTLREKFGKWIVIFIAICILGFLIQDAIQSNTSIFSSRKDYIAKINGTKINPQEFESKYNENLESYNLNNPKKEMDAMTQQSIRDQTWNDILREYTAGVEYQKLGILLSDDEIADFLFENPHPQIKQSFSNPETGEFSSLQVRKFIENLGQDDPNITSYEKTFRWNNFMKFIKKDKIETKYKSLLQKAVFIPDWLIAFENNNNATVSAKYINIPYAIINDSEIKVTDADLQAFINKNQMKYTDEASRKLEYVQFNIIPSAADSAATLSTISALKDTFETVKDDSMFVTINSETRFNTTYQDKTDLNYSYTDTLFKLPIGTLIGPVFESGSYQMIKIIDRRAVADTVEARHILLRISAPEDSAKILAKADSILRAITDSASFVKLAAAYSADASNSKKGGYLGNITQGQTVYAFNKHLFLTGKIGEPKIIKTQFGVHIVEVLKRKNVNDAVKIAIISKELLPSKETEEKAYAAASKFSDKATNVEEFATTITDQELQKQMTQSIPSNAINISGIGISRELVKWAYENKKDAISNIFSLDDKYIVARVAEVREKGLPNIADMKDELTQLVMNEKKSEKIKENIKKANANTIDSLASIMGVTVTVADGVTFKSPQVGEVSEPKLAAAISGCATGKMTTAIAGNGGVYVGAVNSITPIDGADAAGSKMRLSQIMRSKFESELYRALEKASDIDDNRMQFQ